MSHKVGVCGATGYTGLELIQLIERHPHVDVGWITSESSAGKRFSDVHAGPWHYELISIEEGMHRADEVDTVFLCLPHAASIGPVRRFAETGVRVIDLSADYRLKDASAYRRWYGIEHTATDLLREFAYGLCEVYRDELRGADKIAVPGCYPSSVNLALYPLAQAGWLGERIIVDSKSGVSGAGRKASLAYSFVEAHDNMTPYSVGYRHRHIAEMEQVLNHATPSSVNGTGSDRTDHRFIFTPHLLPVNRGILSTMYVTVREGVTQGDVRTLYQELYGDEPFIQLLAPGQAATLRHVTHSNRCAISIEPTDPADPNGPDYVIVATIDNLLKGASGAAIQNFNLSVGLDETTGLL